MRTVNKMRAEMLTPIFKIPETEHEEEARLIDAVSDVDCQFTVNALASKLLMGTISCSEEVASCDTSSCSSTLQSAEYQTLNASQSLRSDFSNLADAIVENFPDFRLCPDCEKELDITRQFRRFIFIQVSYIFYLCQYFCLNIFTLLI